VPPKKLVPREELDLSTNFSSIKSLIEKNTRSLWIVQMDQTILCQINKKIMLDITSRLGLKTPKKDTQDP